MQAAVLYAPRQPLVIEDLRLDPPRAGAGARGCDLLLLEALYVTIRLVLQDGMVAVVRASPSRTSPQEYDHEPRSRGAPLQSRW